MPFDFRCQTTVQIFLLKETRKVRTEEISTMVINKICLQSPAVPCVVHSPVPGSAEPKCRRHGAGIKLIWLLVLKYFC